MLLALAGRSKAHDIEAEGRRLVPDLTTTVLAGASHHSLPATDPDPLNRALAEFLTA